MPTDTSALRSTPKPSFTIDALDQLWRDKVDNMLLAWREFEEKKLVVESRPFKLILELTENCNFKCVMCPQSTLPKYKTYDPKLNMPLETFMKVAEKLFPKAVFADLRGFGETTILPYWPEVVEELDRFPLVDFFLVTNLSLPRDATWQKMMKQGFLLAFSCDGASKEVFEKIRVRSHFETILHNLEVVRDARRRYGTGNIFFISTVQSGNFHEMSEIVRLAHRYEVGEVQFKAVRGEFGPELAAVPQRTFEAAVAKALDVAIELGVRVTLNDWMFSSAIDPEKVRKAEGALRHYSNFGTWLARNNRPPHKDPEAAGKIHGLIAEADAVSRFQRCFKPFHMAFINSAGKMGTCNHMMTPDILEMGDLNTQTLEEVWNCQKYQEFRRKLLSARPDDPRCQWCFKHRLTD